MGRSLRSIALSVRMAMLLPMLAVAFVGIAPALAQDLSLADKVRALVAHADEGIEAAEQNDPNLMRVEYEEIEAIWQTVEDQVRAGDAAGYAEIESSLDRIKDAVATQPLDTAAVKSAYVSLKVEAGEVADRLAAAARLGAQVSGLAAHAQEGIEAAEQNRVEIARAEYAEIHAIWETFEDQVSAKDPAAYAELESALEEVKTAVNTQAPDLAAVKAAYARLEQAAKEIGDRLGGAAAAPAAAETVSLPDALKRLDAAYTAVERGDVDTAEVELDAFIRAWPAVEGVVAARSQDAYSAVEGEMGRARAAIDARPADAPAAEASIERMRAALAPLAGEQSYTAFDAALIILREGLEALLVIVALLAFLRRSGNQDKRGWIWAGGALGVLASVVTAVILQTIFGSVSAGVNREVLEGVTGLAAAALLFYVSYWLHSKASLHAWKKYIDARTTQALARGSMLGLALLAFLAVFREGAETTVFYLGMAPSIALRDLLLGFGVGAAVLLIAAVLMLVVGVKLPLRPFFQVAGLLVYYLGFKFVGTGLHALQVAGVLPATPLAGLAPNPVFELFGIYPTWQTLLPQVALLLGALAVWLYLRMQDRRARTLGTPAAA